MPTQTIEDVFREICAREGPLRQRLEDFSQAVRTLSLPFAEAYDDLVERVVTAGAGSGAPDVGDAMPPFVLPDRTGRLVSLDELLAHGPLVISFNRGHWCEYCAIELTALRQALGAFAARGATVISIMPETQAFISEASAAQGDAFTILSDLDNAYALEVGLVVWLGDRVRKVYIEHGLRLEKYQDSESWFVPIPATFVVGPDGVIAGRYVDPDFRRRMDIAEIENAISRISRV